MKEKTKVIWSILSGVLIFCSIFVMAYAGFKGTNTYVLDITIPGIVEGTAKAIDTNLYFTKNDLTSASVDIAISCNDSNNLQVSIGYKDSTYDLLSASAPTKEIILWSGKDNFPSNSMEFSDTSASIMQKSEINRRWDLFGIGFTTNDYVKADERIWYLKVKDVSGGPYGYERNVTEEINGTLVTLPDYVPNINSIDNFVLDFNGLTFKTLLHPYFDGSCEIIVPIRGVDHELAIRDEDVAQELQVKGSWSSTTTSGGYFDEWAVVFATGDYKGTSDDSQFIPLAGYLFIMGENPILPSSYYHHPNGIYDYGYSVMYCMDYKWGYLPTETCSATDESYLKAMLSSADSKLGYNDKLIVYVDGHGGLASGLKHVTKTSNTRWIFPIGWINVMRIADYYNYIDYITSDGTYVFLWVHSCHGTGLDSFSTAYHNNHLEVWRYNPYAYKQVWTAGPDYRYAYWQYTHSGEKASEGDLFFTNLEESYPDPITDIGDDIEDYFDDETNSDLWTRTHWGTYDFYV